MGDFDEMRRLIDDAVVHNLFLGGVSGTINTAALLAAKFNIPESNILGFTISGANIKARMTISSGLADTAFKSNGNLTYLIASENTITSLGVSQNGNDFQLFGTPNCKHVISTGVTYIGRQAMQNNGADKLYYPYCTSLGNSALRSKTIVRGYFPILSLVHVDAFYTTSRTGQKIYVNPALATSNGGGVDAGIQNFITNGGTVVYIANTTPPSAPSGLSAGTITSTSVVLNFTPPASTNALDFYEVNIDNGTDNPIQLYTSFKELTASGQTLTGLSSGTTYKIKIRACDIYFNRSVFSNEISITTL